jgi:hypothetical protein
MKGLGIHFPLKFTKSPRPIVSVYRSVEWEGKELGGGGGDWLADRLQ